MYVAILLQSICSHVTSIDTGFLAGSGLEVGGALTTRDYSIVRGTIKECGRTPYIGLTPTYIKTEYVKNIHNFFKKFYTSTKNNYHS